MSEEAWHAARLIPTSGISGPEEQERGATSALLSGPLALVIEPSVRFFTSADCATWTTR